MAAPTSEPRVVEGSPSTLPLMLKAALPVLPGVNLVPGVRKHGDTLPDLALTRHDVPVDRAHVAAYSEVCGFPLKETLPVTYPHLLAFGLHMAIMTDGSFPFPAVGTVHLENSITQHRPISAGRAAPGHREARRPAPARQGPGLRHADHRALRRRAGVGGDQHVPAAGRRRPGGAGERPRRLEQPASTGTTWPVAGDLGRRYAAVSGDHNPIHLYALTAKAFGFPRQIAHGMWSKARCLAALEGRLPDAVTVEVAFRKPVLLPGPVLFGSARRDDGYAFALARPKDGKPHLVGRFRPAEA